MDIQKRADVLHRADDREIQEFFREVVFQGVYRKASQDEKTRLNWICGVIENVSLNGRFSDLCPRSQVVPEKFGARIDEGLCEFTAAVDMRALRERGKYQLLVQTVRSVKVERMVRDVESESRFCRNLKLKDKKFIGQFQEQGEGSFTINDIRRSDFSKLILQNGKPQPPIEYKPSVFTPNPGKYYEFSWVLQDTGGGYSYTFGVDESAGLVEITPHEVVNRLYGDIMDYPAGAAQKIVKMLDTLKNQLTASGKEIFIYELLQNANDYPIEIDEGGLKKKLPVDVEFHLTKTSLVFMHNGAPFTEKNVAAICSINDKEKDTNKEAIGYKGIGFKTVFLDNENVYLQTGGYSFRFDREASRDIVDTPWQILPVWTKYSDLTAEERAIFAKANGFNVKFALTPTKQETLYLAPRNYAQMFREVFASERVILFIPNLRSVRVYTKVTSVPDIVCTRGNDRWRVDAYEEIVDSAVTESINESIDEQEDSGALKIPTKYFNFKKTKVSFACEVDGRKLKPVSNTCLYCYLPAKNADWGLKFLMNTDMIPNGQRDDVEVDFDKTVNVNEEISKIAGTKFFDWMHDLCVSGRYDLDTVFCLVPNFLKIKAEKPRKYEALIEAFRTGFESRLENEAIVPVQDRGKLAVVSRVVLDETGLSSSGVMTDAEFLSFSDLDGKCLPVAELRKALNIERFLGAYLKQFGAEGNVFTKKSLRIMANQDTFKKWLKIQGNNDKFLKFLLDRGYFEDFLDEEIFIEEECGNLYKASDIYYDVDEDLEDLRAFSRHIPRLSLKTREFFDADENWHEVCAGAFATFRAREFVEKVLLSETNWNETIRLLHDQKTSIHFYLFLAKKDLALSRLEDLPFFNADQSPVEAFKDRFVFFDSDVGRETCSAAWLSSVPFAFLSPLYGDRVNDYLAKNACVRVFSDEVIVGDIILDEDFCVKVNAAQQTSFEASKSFVDYCFEHRDCFSESASLSGYALRVADVRGEQNWILPSDDHVYFSSDAYSEVSGCEWLGADWMYCLDEGYLASAIPELKDFIRVRFDVEIFKIGTFFDDIVVREFTAIRKAVDTKEKSIAFHAFVIKNKDDLTAKQVEVMKGAPVYLYGQEEPSISSSGHRVLSSKARELQEEGLVEFSDLDIISPEYHPEDHADYWETLLGNAKFTVVDFVNWTRANQNAFGERIKDLNLNVSFWRWLRDSEISDETIKALPVLPLCLKDGTWGETSEVVYLSDEYIQGGGVETLVKSFNPKAAFIGPEYLNDNEVESWKEFWIRIGLRFEILGILKDAIDNRLGEIQDAKLVSTLAKHRTDLEKSYGDGLPARLADLKLQSRDGQFRSLNEIVYVDCEKSEPFPCVELPNQVSFVTADERRLMTDVLNINGGSKIDSLQGWRRAKISRYLQIQEDASQIDLLRSIHYAFVDELAVLCAQGLEELEFEGKTDQENLELVRKVLFLDRKNQFVPAERLTEGSAYEPFCDFERFGLEYDYLSDSYKTSCASDVRRLLSRVFHVHCDFREDDIPQLENRGFAIYFWKEYLPKVNFKTRIQGMIEERKFDSVACIPTKDHMKRPDEVYSPDKNMALYVRAIEDFENKVPLKDIPEVEYDSGKTFFALLLNKKENLQLSFLDALYALFSVVGQGSRSQLLEWMIDSYDPKYDENIRLYRADDGAKWKNTQNEDVHITKLYALAHDDKNLEQYFGTLPQIINNAYFPTGDDFETACKILGITVIRMDDVIVDFHDPQPVDIKTTLKIQALALAYCADKEGWKNLYDSFKQLIEHANFCRCPVISLRYKRADKICQERKKFYRAGSSSSFYFVESLVHPRVFKGFVDSFVEYLGLADEKLDSDLVETIMESETSAEEWLQENNDLKLDDDFQLEMERLKPASRGRFVGNRADGEEVVDDGGRHVITVPEKPHEKDHSGSGRPSGLSQGNLGFGEGFSDEANATNAEVKPGIASSVELGTSCGNSSPRSGDPLVQTEILPAAEDSSDAASEEYEEDWAEADSAEDCENFQPLKRPDGGVSRESSRQDSTRRRNGPSFNHSPKPFSAEDVERLRPQGKPRSLSVLEPTQSEISDLNGILDGPLSPEEIADQNYLAQLRLYRNLEQNGMHPEESLDDFVKNGSGRKEHSLSDGKYIHKCSAAGGILYLSPAIWNKIASGKCVVCVYLGAKANDFMYFRSIEDILNWVREDDIVIKLTGVEKARTVEALYSSVLKDIKGTAYTMLRVQSNERYDSLFAPLDPTVADSSQESEDEY